MGTLLMNTLTEVHHAEHGRLDFAGHCLHLRHHEQFAAETPVSYETEMKANICQCLAAVLDTMKEEYRTALQTVDLGGHSVGEYAKAGGMSPNNAGVRLHRARKAAAKRLTQVCGACAEHKCVDCTCRRSAV